MKTKQPAHFIVTRLRETSGAAPILDTPDSVFEAWHDSVKSLPDFEAEKERLVVFVLNTKFRLIGVNTVSIGSMNEAVAHPREIFRPVIALGGFALILAHNHPSGDPSPSMADHNLTRRIREGGELLNIRLLDHVVIGEKLPERDKAFYSFKEAGIL